MRDHPTVTRAVVNLWIEQVKPFQPKKLNSSERDRVPDLGLIVPASGLNTRADR